jgi:hypothetical protein
MVSYTSFICPQAAHLVSFGVAQHRDLTIVEFS